MADVFIETYRGYDIYFNITNERFYTSTDNDKWNEKQSYASVKKYIDEYIKNNIQFKPFTVVGAPDSYEVGKKIKIIGIRKDGRFIIEQRGKKKQLSEYDEQRWILENEDNDKHFAAIAALESKIDEIREKIKQEKSKIKCVPLKSIKANYIV